MCGGGGGGAFCLCVFVPALLPLLSPLTPLNPTNTKNQQQQTTTNNKQHTTHNQPPHTKTQHNNNSEVAKLKEETWRSQEDHVEALWARAVERNDRPWIILACFLFSVAIGLLTVVAWRINHLDG